MKKFLIAIALVLSALTASADGLTIEQLAGDYVNIRVDANETSRYLLLPIEEQAGESQMNIIANGNLVRSLNVRLAIGRTDYYVPIDLNEFRGKNLTITTHLSIDHGNHGGEGSRHRLSEIKLSNTFDKANREKFRPVYHHTPEYGWMNDPNGMFYKDGEWHLFYQHNPYGSTWGNMHWGHSVSKDLIHWEELGDALAPDAIGTIFSGSSVVDQNNTAGFGRGAVVSMYTSCIQTPFGHDLQSQSLAYSTDGGKNFKKYEGNPILTSKISDFRDPNMFWHEPTQRWILMLAEKTHLNLYSSKDLKNWKYESNFGEDYGSHGGVWECPDLFEINGKWFLLLNINSGGPFGGSATQYFVGNFDGHQFTCEDDKNEVKWLDYGKDHYATVSFSNAPNGRVVVLPWMSNWQYANNVPTKQYRAANGIARDLGSFSYKGETYLSVKPSPEVMAAFSKKATNKLSDACRIDVQLKGNATITLANGNGEQLTMTYDAKAETLAMDRTKSGDVSFSADFPAVTTSPTYGKVKNLQIFVDRSSIEVFDADGKMGMTNIVFPSEPYNKITVKGGKAKIFDLNK